MERRIGYLKKDLIAKAQSSLNKTIPVSNTMVQELAVKVSLDGVKQLCGCCG